MATSIRDLKKDLKYTFENLIEQALLMQVASGGEDKKINSLVNEMVDAYDEFLTKINMHRKAENKKQFFKELNAQIEEKIKDFQRKLEAL